MSMINKEISDFRTYAFHENDFKFVSKEDILGKWSVFFFYPADFTFVCPTELFFFQNQYPVLCPGQIQGGGEPRRTTTNHDHIVQIFHQS